MATKFVTGTVVTVPTAGDAVQLLTSTPAARAAASILVQAQYSNTGYIYIGDENVTDTDGLMLGPGETIEFGGNDRRSGQDELILSDLYITSDVDGESVRVGFFVRRPGPNP